MGDDYLLVSHPYPQIEGEMLIFQPNADDKCDKDLLVYRDYSLKKRNKYFNPRYQLSAAQKKEKEEKMMTSTKLQCLEIASDDPLSPCDWKHMATIVQEASAITWVQILPVGQKSSQPFQFNSIHVLPSAKIPFHKIPLDTMIADRINYIKKREKAEKKGGMATINLQPLSRREEDAIEAGVITLPEF